MTDEKEKTKTETELKELPIESLVAPTENKLIVSINRRGINGYIWSALTASLFPGASAYSILAAWDYCKARSLDIMKKPVHIVPMRVKEGDSWRWRDVIMPGIPELRITAMRTREYDGQDPPEYGPEIEYEGVKAPEWCQITVYRKGISRGFTHKEYFREAVATKSENGKPNATWTRRPIGMLGKCTEAGALRKAFPEELGGQYAAEELEGKEEHLSDERTPITVSASEESGDSKSRAGKLAEQLREEQKRTEEPSESIETQVDQGQDEPTKESVPNIPQIKEETKPQDGDQGRFTRWSEATWKCPPAQKVLILEVIKDIPADDVSKFLVIEYSVESPALLDGKQATKFYKLIMSAESPFKK